MFFGVQRYRPKTAVVKRNQKSKIRNLKSKMALLEYSCQILKDDIQKLAAVNAGRTMPCECRRQPPVQIVRNLACNIASVPSVGTTGTAKWCR